MMVPSSQKELSGHPHVTNAPRAIETIALKKRQALPSSRRRENATTRRSTPPTSNASQMARVMAASDTLVCMMNTKPRQAYISMARKFHKRYPGRVKI